MRARGSSFTGSTRRQPSTASWRRKGSFKQPERRRGRRKPPRRAVRHHQRRSPKGGRRFCCWNDTRLAAGCTVENGFNLQPESRSSDRRGRLETSSRISCIDVLAPPEYSNFVNELLGRLIARVKFGPDVVAARFGAGEWVGHDDLLLGSSSRASPPTDLEPPPGECENIGNWRELKCRPRN